MLGPVLNQVGTPNLGYYAYYYTYSYYGHNGHNGHNGHRIKRSGLLRLVPQRKGVQNGATAEQVNDGQ